MRPTLEGELLHLFGYPKEEAILTACLAEALEARQRSSPRAPAATTVHTPSIFGLITSCLLSRDDLPRDIKLRAANTLFDTIPLPESEDEAFATVDKVPPGLQETAHFLLLEEEFLEYHLLHLIYALYIDPSLASHASTRILEENLRLILEADALERMKLLYAYLLLSAPTITPSTAEEFLSTLLNSHLSEDAKRSFALAAVDAPLGVVWFVELAMAEGLYPREAEEEELFQQARVHPLPETLADPAHRWLVDHEG